MSEMDTNKPLDNLATDEIVENIMANREKYLQAFIAETGLPPSQVVSVEQIRAAGLTTYFVRRKADNDEIDSLKQEKADLLKQLLYAKARLEKFEKRFNLEDEIVPKEWLDHLKDEQIKAYYSLRKRGDHSTNIERLISVRHIERIELFSKLKNLHSIAWCIEHNDEIEKLIAHTNCQAEMQIAREKEESQE